MKPAFLLILAMVLMGCTKPSTQITENGASEPQPSTSIGPSPASLNGLDAIAALAVANTWKGNASVTTYVDQKEISFSFSSGKTVAVPLPQDEMVVAIAPYFQKTHPCEIHYMSGCQGELVNQTFEVTAIDADGHVIIEDAFVSMPNGFIELWLPRNNQYSVEITAGGKSAMGTVGTYADSNTCITTMKLT